MNDRLRLALRPSGAWFTRAFAISGIKFWLKIPTVLRSVPHPERKGFWILIIIIPCDPVQRPAWRGIPSGVALCWSVITDSSSVSYLPTYNYAHDPNSMHRCLDGCILPRDVRDVHDNITYWLYLSCNAVVWFLCATEQDSEEISQLLWVISFVGGQCICSKRVWKTSSGFLHIPQEGMEMICCCLQIMLIIIC